MSKIRLLLAAAADLRACPTAAVRAAQPAAGQAAQANLERPARHHSGQSQGAGRGEPRAEPTRRPPSSGRSTTAIRRRSTRSAIAWSASIEDYTANFRDLSERQGDAAHRGLPRRRGRPRSRCDAPTSTSSPRSCPGRTVARFYQIENKMDAVLALRSRRHDPGGRARSGGAPAHRRPAAHRHDDPARAAGAGSGQPRADDLGGDAPVAAARARAPTTPIRASPRSTSTSPASTACIPGFKTMHPMGAQLPQECVALTAHDFASMLFSTTHRVPSYQAWLDRADLRWVYASHRRQLQYLQWRCPAERWVLKSPGHLWALDALLADLSRRAHRADAPRSAQGRSRRSPASSRCCAACRAIASIRAAIGAEWTARLADGLQRAIAVRDASAARRRAGRSTCTSASSSATRSAWCAASTRTSASSSALEAEARMRRFLAANPQGQARRASLHARRRRPRSGDRARALRAPTRTSLRRAVGTVGSRQASTAAEPPALPGAASRAAPADRVRRPSAGGSPAVSWRLIHLGMAGFAGRSVIAATGPPA